MLHIKHLVCGALLVLAGSLILPSAHAQATFCNEVLKGVVRDADGTPLTGATVWIDSLKSGDVSHADGSFVITKLCPRTYTLRISMIGYETTIVTVSLPTASSVSITMNTDARMLHEIIVEGEHAQQHSLSQSVSTLSTEELDAGKGKPLGELLQQLPGVSSLMMGPAIFKPVIHGLHSQRILILNNGIRQEGQQWGFEHAPEIDTYIASEIEVVKGAEAVRYGADALGGVIIINTPPLTRQQGLTGEVNMGFMSNSRMGTFSASVESGFKNSERWKWRLQSSVKKGGDFHAPDYNLSNTGVEELNFSGTLGFTGEGKSLEIYASSFNSEIGILRSAHTGNLDDLQNSIENNRPWFIKDFSYDIENPRQKINHQLLKVKADKTLEGIGKLHVLYGGQFNQRKEFDIRRGGRSDRAALSMELFSHVLDASLDHTLGQWSGSVGINGTLRSNTNVPGTGIKPLIPDYNLYAGGIFIFEKRRSGNWMVELGARFDHQYLQVLTFDQQNNLIKPAFNFNYVSGSAAASYYFSPQTRITSNLGISTRPPHVSEAYSEGLHHGTGAIEEGFMLQGSTWLTDQSDMKPEVSKKWITTFQHASNTFTAELSVYANLIDRYIYLQPTETRLTIRGYFPVLQYQRADALLTGADISVNWNIAKQLSYQGKASYLYAEDIQHNDKLPFIPPAQFENALTYRWTTAGTLKSMYATVSVPSVLKQYRAPVTVYPNAIPTYTGDDNFDFMPAPAGYTLLNIEAGTKIPVGKHDLSISLAGNNLLNKSYRNYLNRLRYYADDMGRNFSIRLKYNFHTHESNQKS